MDVLNLPVDLNNYIVDYLCSLPTINDKDTRNALIQRAGLGYQLDGLIDLGVSGNTQFAQKLVDILVKYGKVDADHDALEAVLKASKRFVGIDKQQCADLLIQEWRIHQQKPQNFVPGVTCDIVVTYASPDNKMDDKNTGWVTKFMKDLRQQVKVSLKATPSMKMVCLDYQVDGTQNLSPESLEILCGAAVMIAILSSHYIDVLSDELKRSIKEQRRQLDSTIFSVEREQIDGEQRPDEFPRLSGYVFDNDLYQSTLKLKELSSQIAQTLRNLPNEKAAPEKNRSKRTLEQSESSPTVFVNWNRVDESLGKQIVNCLKKQAIDSFVPLQGGKAKDRRECFKKFVKNSELFITVYGAVPPQWVSQQIIKARKLIGQRKEKIVYDGPPNQKPDLPFDFLRDVRIIPFRQGICDTLEKQLLDLIRVSHQGREI